MVQLAPTYTTPTFGCPLSICFLRACIPYYPALPSLGLTTNRHISILHTSERLQGAFPLPPLIAYRRLKNLRDILVRASLTSGPCDAPSNKPCGAARFKTCLILLAMDVFSSHTMGEQFREMTAASCKSSSVTCICLITCRRCSQQYMGEAGQPLHCRINGHCYDIVYGRIKDSSMAAHFNNNEHSQADMTVMVTDEV